MKSLLVADEQPIVLAWADQVDGEQLEALTGKPVRRADAAVQCTTDTRSARCTRFVEVALALPDFIERDLTRHAELSIAAAGTPAVFRLTPEELCRMTDAVDLKRWT